MESGSGGGELSLKAACCACLTELVVNDANGQQTVQNNGIYLLAMLLVQPITACRRHHVTATAAAADKPDAATVHLQVTLALSPTIVLRGVFRGPLRLTPSPLGVIFTNI